MTKLDEIALSIEITLISIVEGFALSALASAVLPLGGLPLEYYPYALAGLLFLLIFWSQSVLHAVSFIRWPLSPAHMMLYFVAAFVQVVAYGHLTNPTAWFFWWTAFVGIGLILYLVDLAVLRREHAHFAAIEGGAAFIGIVERRHLFEARGIVLIAFIFNIALFIFCALHPVLSKDFWFVVATGIAQVILGGIVLSEGLHNFTRRCRMLTPLYLEH